MKGTSEEEPDAAGGSVPEQRSIPSQCDRQFKKNAARYNSSSTSSGKKGQVNPALFYPYCFWQLAFDREFGSCVGEQAIDEPR
jgi:hypothetical protein